MIALQEAWLAAARRVSRWAVWAAGALMLAAALLVSVEVFLRKLFLVSIGGADELSGYAFAIATSWALAFTLLERANVRVDAVYQHLPSGLRALLDVAGLLVLGGFVGLLAWHGWAVLQDSLAFKTLATTPLQTPLWIPQTLWVVGFGIFAFAWVPLVLRVLRALFSGDRATAARLAGARSIEEDAQAEIAHTRPANGGGA